MIESIKVINFSNEIFVLATFVGMFKRSCCITPIPIDTYPAPVKRPVCSLLYTKIFRKSFDLVDREFTVLKMYDLDEKGFARKPCLIKSAA